tara:strand:+ start:61 stop:687 length:627 start_codon:yes stop_codon:yes gene_type:complete
MSQRYLYRLKDGTYYFQKVFKNYGGQYRISLRTKKLDVALFRRDEILEKWQEIEWNNTLLNPTGDSEGYIYCIGNPNYVGWVKVGRTKDPDGRLRTGYNCYAPNDDFYYIIKKKVTYYKIIEKHLIEIFTKYCGQHKQKSEWFRTDECNAIKYFKETIDTSNEYLLKKKTYTDAELEDIFDSYDSYKGNDNSIVKKDLLRNIQSYANR